MSLLIREEYVNVTKGHIFGDSGAPYEPFTDDLGRLFKSLKSEYGKVGSKVYVDTAEGVQHVGWCFVKRMQYDDARDNSPKSHYIREVWVTLYEPCEADDPRAVVTRHSNGAITKHPFRQVDIEARRRAAKRR